MPETLSSSSCSVASEHYMFILRGLAGPVTYGHYSISLFLSTKNMYAYQSPRRTTTVDHKKRRVVIGT